MRLQLVMLMPHAGPGGTGQSWRVRLVVMGILSIMIDPGWKIHCGCGQRFCDKKQERPRLIYKRSRRLDAVQKETNCANFEPSAPRRAGLHERRTTSALQQKSGPEPAAEASQRTSHPRLTGAKILYSLRSRALPRHPSGDGRFASRSGGTRHAGVDHGRTVTFGDLGEVWQNGTADGCNRQRACRDRWRHRYECMGVQTIQCADTGTSEAPAASRASTRDVFLYAMNFTEGSLS